MHGYVMDNSFIIMVSHYVVAKFLRIRYCVYLVIPKKYDTHSNKCLYYIITYSLRNARASQVFFHKKKSASHTAESVRTYKNPHATTPQGY